MRGLFTAGILDVFMKNGIVFDGVIGVSAGAVFGCNYKSHQIGRVLRYNTRFARYPEYCSLRSLITTGDLYGKQFCYVDVPERLEPFDTETFIRDPSSFWAVAISLAASTIACIPCAVGSFIIGRVPLGIAWIGCGMVCAGLAILLFLCGGAVTRGLITVIRKMAGGFFKLFRRKERRS